MNAHTVLSLDSWIIYRGDHAETNCYGGDITDASWRLYKFSPDEDSIDIRMNTSQGM